MQWCGICSERFIYVPRLTAQKYFSFLFVTHGPNTAEGTRAYSGHRKRIKEVRTPDDGCNSLHRDNK